MFSLLRLMRTAWWWAATWQMHLQSQSIPTSLAEPPLFSLSAWQEMFGISVKTKRIHTDTLSSSASSQVASGLTQALASTLDVTKASTPSLLYSTRSFRTTTSMGQMTSTSPTWTTGCWSAQTSLLMKTEWSTLQESVSDVTLLTIL